LLLVPSLLTPLTALQSSSSSTTHRTQLLLLRLILPVFFLPEW
jgi:hypothetical protein